MNRLMHVLPLLIFGVLVLVLFYSLENKNDQLESVLIDKDFPDFSLTMLEDRKLKKKKKD